MTALVSLFTTKYAYDIPDIALYHNSFGSINSPLISVCVFQVSLCN